MAQFLMNEEVAYERNINKNEMNELEGLLFYIQQNLDNGSLKASNEEGIKIIHEVVKYLGKRHDKIETREQELDKQLAEAAEKNAPKSFM